MKNEVVENISLLTDGELSEAEKKTTLDVLSKDDNLQRCWRDYHLIGDALRKSLPEVLQHDVSMRIHKALEKEPTYFLPNSAISSQSSPSTRFSRRSRYATGFALAASFLLTVVLGLQWQGSGKPNDTAQIASLASGTVQITDTSPKQAARIVKERSLAEETPTEPAATQLASDTARQFKAASQLATRQRTTIPPSLASYLIDHNEHSFRGPMRGELMPYVRIVGYQSEQR